MLGGAGFLPSTVWVIQGCFFTSIMACYKASKKAAHPSRRGEQMKVVDIFER